MAICEYGNCHENELPVCVTVQAVGHHDGLRKRFCSLTHAALWAVREAYVHRFSVEPNVTLNKLVALLGGRHEVEYGMEELK